MSDVGKSQEPSMEEILASIRRIIAEDEAGRVRSGSQPAPPRGSTDGPSRTPRGPVRSAAPEIHAPARLAPPSQSGDLVLDLTNMVAADGSVVTIAPTFPNPDRAPPPPQGFAENIAEQQTVPYGGFARRAPPPGPGAEPRPAGLTPPPLPPLPQAQPMGFAPQGNASTDSPSRGVRGNGAPPPAPLPPLSEDSPSRRVFKRRHTAGNAFAELAQGGFPPPQRDANGSFGKVPVGAVTTELDMGAHAPQPAAHMPPPQSYAPPAPPPLPMAAPPALSSDQVRSAVAEVAEPMLRAWLDANLAAMVEQQLAGMVQARIEESVTGTLPQMIDQQIHQNVEANLGPYIEDRVGAHVDARLAAAVDEKVAAAVKQQLATAFNQQVAQAISQQVSQAVGQQLQAQQQNLTRVIDDRVKSESRGLFQRLAGN